MIHKMKNILFLAAALMLTFTAEAQPSRRGKPANDKSSGNGIATFS
ncbi:MAG: hypothetical protein RL386_959, partial [Bacteroidota bacterium]